MDVGQRRIAPSGRDSGISGNFQTHQIDRRAGHSGGLESESLVEAVIAETPVYSRFSAHPGEHDASALSSSKGSIPVLTVISGAIHEWIRVTHPSHTNPNDGFAAGTGL
jgi:hypothetical protein